MPDYIEVVRHFFKLESTLEEQPAWLPRRGGGLTWKQVLRPEQNDAVVLLAPSGYGKSTEVFQQARRLRTEGTHVISTTAVAVAAEGLRGGLDAENREQLEAWLKTADPAIVFVDAIDELALRQKNLGDLIRKLDGGIPFSQRTVQLVVTARTGMWLPHHTGELANFLKGGLKKEPPVLQISFSSLDEVALRALATGYGARDVDELIASIRREEIRSLFDIRPRDVSWLVRRWNETGRLGKWVELLTDFCESALTDETPDRAVHRELSTRDAHLGLQRTAAAMLFGRRNFISVPSAERSELTISSRRLFDDWTTTKVQNLLETALFVHKGMNGQAVQLASDTLTPFLAARWLARRAQAGLEIDELRERVMVRAFADREFHIPASRTALAGWLATELPEFRSVVLRERPELVLFGGDPDLLTDQEIETGLAGIAIAMLTGPTRHHTRSGLLRKLARPSIDGVVLSLLSTRPTTISLQLLALELARHGQYRSCVPLAVVLAIDADTIEYVRIEAIRTVIEVGDALAWNQLIPLTSDPSPRVRAQLLELVPQTISGAALVRLMQRGGKLEFRLIVSRMIRRVSDHDLDAIAAALVPARVDAQTESTFCAALPVVTESIRRGRSSASVIMILRSIEWMIDHAAAFIDSSEVEALHAAFARHARSRRRLIKARLVEGLDHPHSMRHVRFGRPAVEDVRWLVNDWMKSRRAERHRARGPTAAPHKPQRSDLIRWLLDELHDGLQGDEQMQVRAALPNELQVSIDARATRSRDAEQTRTSREAETKRQALAERAKNAQGARSRLKGIESGDDVDALIRAWQMLGPEEGSKRARRDVSRLAEFVGEELVPSFLRGLQAYWRKNVVSVPDPSSNRVLLNDLVGLTGLTLEIDNGLDLKALSPDEARQAATYALRELNSFPTWFPDLVVAQRAATTSVLREAVTRAWSLAEEHHTLLRFGPYAGKVVASALRSLVLDVATIKRPGSRQALEDGIDTLLTSDDEPRRVAKIAIVGITTDATDDGRLAQWLRLLAHVEPVAAAGQLELLRATDLERYNRIIETVADVLERDLSDRYRMSLVTAMYSPRALGRWFRLLLLGVSPETDLPFPTEEMRALGPRDHAQDFRERCVGLLRQDPAQSAHEVLVELANDPVLASYRPMLLAAVADQLEVARDAVARPLTEDQILAIERGDEGPPRNLDDLFSMVRSHIAHVDRLISVDDDFSYRSIFSKHTVEEKLQLWTASCLRTRARGLYSVIRENVVADKKEVDISATSPDVGQVPIEIKPLGPYSFNALKDVIVDQLLGQYMRPKERLFGILLLVRRERTHWIIDGKRRTLDRLVSDLQGFAERIGSKNGKTIAVEVIDLLEKSGSSNLRRPLR